MSARDFDAALSAPDNDATHKRLQQLACANSTSGATLPATAEAYLRAFCAGASSLTRRRWVGLGLRKMIDKSGVVVAHMKTLTQELPRLGQVILHNTEAEETKIVAALVIRQGLESGIDFARFWPSRKVQDNAPIFPKTAGPRWMHQFQEFLDVLNDLVVANPITDPAVLYPVSLLASDGYKWRDDVISIVLMQSELVTVVIPDSSVHDISFMDIPLHHIHNVTSQRSKLHDSQGIGTKLEPWEVVLTLMPGQWTYRLDSSEREGRFLTIMFAKKDDAVECKNCIESFLPQSSPPRIQSSAPVNFEQESVQEEGLVSDDELAQSPPVSQREVEGTRSTPHAMAVSQSKVVKSQTVTTKEPDSCSEGLEPRSHPLLSTPMNHESPKSGIGDGTPISAVQTRATRPKLGALPMVKKPAGPKVNGKKSMVEVDDATFEFPDWSPRIKRRSVPTQKRSRVGNANTKKFISKAKPIRPKAKPKTMQANDIEEEGDPISSQVLQPSGPEPSQLHSPIDTLDNATKTSVVAPKSPNLPTVGNRTDGGASKSQRLASDIFAIPQDDDSQARPRARRKGAKSVIYQEGHTSGEESSGSEYAEKKSRTTRSPAKGGRPSKAVNSKRASKAPNPKSKPSTKNVRNLKAETQPGSLLRGSLLAKSISKSQPPSSAEPKKTELDPGRALKDKENRPPAVDQSARAVSHPADDTVLSSEIHILDRLNDLTHEDEHGFVPVHVSASEKSNVPQKRPAVDSSPLTPPSKRAKKEQTLPNGTAPKSSPLLKAPTMIAPPRVLKDPSSPCRQKRPPSSIQTRKPMHEMYTQSEEDAGQIEKVERPARSQRSTADPRKRPERGHTPIHHRAQRNHSSGSVNQQILSSNSKLLPASPRAESTAISGHAHRDRVAIEREIGEHETAKSDPFSRRSNSQTVTAFTRRLTGEAGIPNTPVGNSQHRPIELIDSGSSSGVSSDVEPMVESPKKPFILPKQPPVKPASVVQIKVENPFLHPRIKISEPLEPISNGRAPALVQPGLERRPKETENVVMDESIRNGPPQLVEETQPQDVSLHAGDVGMEGETLVEQEEEELPTQRLSPVHFKSSPPPLGSPSSHSSTSAEDEPRTEPPIPTSDADEMEWEASLQPHQRSLQEQLIRVSKRVVRHIVDNETAVDDIAQMYAQDSEHMLRTLIDRHTGESDTMFKNVEKKKGKVQKASEQLLKKLGKERQQVLADVPSG
ncbi:hypothetical protein BU26DRAFT_555433 [Trematosphaeria pertusa]|uniref:Uncharacterized protein n=1 Tax=Trematosphaeria pertusa TaxID=390896 RepID=A0A6A6HYT0_9PLEO|nr:uncharacterized protein BU26DRAFT_555433 [Trematosphaeria pertusa]KAF2242773.1 hypothetical protein BU26DRAFT_555433 [Trematosphaeria pertusa]